MEGRIVGRIKLHQYEALYVLTITHSELVGANHSGKRTQKSLLQKLEFKKESEINIILFAVYSDL